MPSGYKGTTTYQPAPPQKMSIAETRKRQAAAEDEIKRLREGCYCYMCGKFRAKSAFNKTSDPKIKPGYAPICKECAQKIAQREDANGEQHASTQESIQEALFYLNKPFHDTVYIASIAESNNTDALRTKSDPWTAYIKNISMPQWAGEGYRDSDMFQGSKKIVYDDEITPEMLQETHEGQDTYSDYYKNKADVIRLLSYDPFDKESAVDQPFLYSQLLGLQDNSEEANDDMMRTASCISIVRGFLQMAKIDDNISALMADPTQLEKNSAVIRSQQDSKKKVSDLITSLAAESCISLKNNKRSKKGENSWTGKLKKIKDLNLRDSAINGFDIDTCKGMQQVADISMSAIVDKLHLDDSEWSDIVAQQRQMVADANKKAEACEEATRLLLRENIELRALLEKHGLLHRDNLVDLDDVINTYTEA